MSLSLNTNVYPKTGYQFKDGDGVLHVSDSWDGVIARVKMYRQRRGIAVGDPASEVTAYACANNPGLCRQENEANKQALKVASLKTRVLQYLSGLRSMKEREPLPFVTDAERAARANVCASCPKNAALPDGCSSCKKAVSELRKTVIGDRFVDGRLNGCVVMGEDLPSAVHIDHTRVDNPELPGHCWRKIQPV